MKNVVALNFLDKVQEVSFSSEFFFCGACDLFRNSFFLV